MGAHPAIRPAAFIRYKFLNSLFLGLSVGAVFVLYTPLSPAVFSAGGIGLALGTLIVATQYRRILAPDWFFRLSLGVELVTLSGVVAVLLFPLELALALFIYIGYQMTFSLGNYLVRCETLLMVSVEQLRKLDVAKQAGYLLGMGGVGGVCGSGALCGDRRARRAGGVPALGAGGYRSRGGGRPLAGLQSGSASTQRPVNPR